MRNIETTFIFLSRHVTLNILQVLEKSKYFLKDLVFLN